MIQIIKSGKKETVCNKCGCNFIFDYSDIKEKEIGDNEFLKYVECPECSSNITEWRQYYKKNNLR